MAEEKVNAEYCDANDYYQRDKEYARQAFEAFLPKRTVIQVTGGPRYLVVGGNPIKSYTGTVTFSGLSVVGWLNTLEQAREIVTSHYDACAGLLIVIDTDTGEEV
jgi:hypothetical protein